MKITLKWSKSISVGIEEIDQQHRDLFSIINDLIHIYKQPGHRNEILRILHAMMKYTERHFSTEDEFMTLYEFPKYLDHRKEHTDYLSKINVFLDGYEKGQDDLPKDMLMFLTTWWRDHTSGSDMDFAIWVKSRKRSAT